MGKKAIPLPKQLHATMALHVMSIAPQWWTSGSFPSIYISLNQLKDTFPNEEKEEEMDDN